MGRQQITVKMLADLWPNATQVIDERLAKGLFNAGLMSTQARPLAWRRTPHFALDASVMNARTCQQAHSTFLLCPS